MGTGAFKSIKYIFNCAINVVFSGMENCILCGSISSENLLCSKCRELVKISYLDYYLKDGEEAYKCYSLGFYSYSIKKLILSLKYGKNFYAGDILGEYLGDFIKNKLREKIDVITFVPSTKDVLRKRGFNQCELLCKNASNHTGIQYKNLLKKVKITKDQIGLTTSERWSNIKGSFTCVNIEYIENKSILLIDDVVTTGATAFYCASTLKKFGAKDVYILTVAKSRV